MLRCVFTASLLLLWGAAFSAAQEAASTEATVAGGGAEAPSGSRSFSDTFSFLRGGFSPYTLPADFARRLLGSVSVGQSRDDGILNGRFNDPGMSSLYFTDIASSFAYDHRGPRSDYMIDYRGTARHYSRFPQLDVLTHDLGLTQMLQIGRATQWTLRHRYMMSPDYGASLMAETLAQQLGFLNPLPSSMPTAGTSVQTAFINPLPAGFTVIPKGFQPATSPDNALLSLRSMHMSNITNAGLTYDVTAQTKMALDLGFSRQRYQDRNLFGINQYSLSGSIDHLLTPRTSVGVSFNGGRLDMVGAFQETLHAGAQLQLSRQFGRSSVVSLQVGPSSLLLEGQRTIPLPSLVANLLGRPSLVRKSSDSQIGWLGGAAYHTNIRSIGLNLDYSRSITDSGGLGGAAFTQAGSVAVSKTFRQRTSFSVSVSYRYLEMLALEAPLSIGQQGLSATFTRQMTRNLDFSTLFTYAKATRGGPQGPVLLDHNIVSARLTYFFHRVSPPAGM